MSQVNVSDIISQIEQLAPKDLAESWDPIGLSFGSLKRDVKRLLIALDIDENTIAEAKRKQADLIITHHPAIFTSQKTLNAEDKRRKQYIDLIKSDIAVYSAHTNLDAAEGGVNDWLADRLGMKASDREILSVSLKREYKKLAVYVPDYAAEKVRKALHQAGAGEVGNYKDVSYTLSGYGRFTPQKGADPAEGEIGKAEQIEEDRIEMMVKDSDVMKCLSALKEAHPYEEPVYDLYILKHYSKSFGLGRSGKLAEPLTTKALAEKVKEQFDVDGVRYGTVDPDRTHKKIAVLGGSGEKYFNEALNKGVTLYITGDISYHGAQDMLREGLDFIDGGHYMEAIIVAELFDYLNQCSKENNWDIEIMKAETQKDVFTYIK
ncbi:Nif3-like dinuclear metal center hexameric protein [Alkalibacterium kapii]|uniref:GTP cyclohydrolase 1 type 2 homolog n=1 Tax=Alkalibacterium kapii TaxID=426704 RepID=A0A511AYI2_9LACT|nr:Nif3-like dinuclear metal center hexameric protein [Alkalibacterium kapii]GEK90667.1 GTP cyclohydrolase 1 type 2 [Alkalibacterium kapii]